MLAERIDDSSCRTHRACQKAWRCASVRCRPRHAGGAWPRRSGLTHRAPRRPSRPDRRQRPRGDVERAAGGGGAQRRRAAHRADRRRACEGEGGLGSRRDAACLSRSREPASPRHPRPPRMHGPLVGGLRGRRHPGAPAQGRRAHASSLSAARAAADGRRRCPRQPVPARACGRRCPRVRVQVRRCLCHPALPAAITIFRSRRPAMPVSRSRSRSTTMPSRTIRPRRSPSRPCTTRRGGSHAARVRTASPSGIRICCAT